MEEVLDFLAHASARGLMPSATATALSVAVRNVFSVLTEEERKDLQQLDLNAVVKRFNNKRARDFSPGSLKEYGRRVQRAMDLYQAWRNDPANFSIKTRSTKATKRQKQLRGGETAYRVDVSEQSDIESKALSRNGGYASSISIRQNWVVTVTNIPADLTVAEAERIAAFVRLLAVD